MISVAVNLWKEMNLIDLNKFSIKVNSYLTKNDGPIVISVNNKLKSTL